LLKKDFIDVLNRQNLNLAKNIRAANGIHRSSPEAYAFIITCLKLMHKDITNSKLQHSITDDDPDAGFDTILISKKTVSIFDFKNNDSLDYRSMSFFARNIEDYLFGIRPNLRSLPIIVKKKIREARDAIRNKYSVNIYIVRNGLNKPRKLIRSLFNNLKSSYKTNIYFINSNDLIEKYFLNKNHIDNFEWPIKIVSLSSGSIRQDKIIVKDGRNIKSMFARIRLSNIVKLQKSCLEKNINLFDSNVRDFHEDKNLSEKIIGSIHKNPKDFYIFHNGLTFACSKIESLSQESYIIYNPQVINGCQTINTIYHKYKKNINSSKLKNAVILCRFYSLEKNMIEKVCEATNTQIKINLWDLRSNDDIQKLLEKALSAEGIEYKRKITKKKSGNVLITELAQWIYSCIFKNPADAKNKKSSLFDILPNNPIYTKIFNPGLELKEIVKICQIAFFVKKKLRSIKNKHSFERHADLHFMAALYKLKNKSWSLDYKFKRIHNIIEETVKILKQRYGKNYNYNKMFTKTNKTWNIIERKLNSL
jgi:hypothetical protein